MLDTVRDLAISVVPPPEPLPAEVIERLTAGYGYAAYRHWQGFGREAARRLLAWELTHGHEDAGTHWRLLLHDAEGLQGLAWAASSPWESEQLGAAMGAVRHLIVLGTSPAQRQTRARELLAALRSRVEERMACLSHSVDVDDAAAIAALEQDGFTLVDTLVSFIGSRGLWEPFVPAMTGRCVVRAMAPEDTPAIEALAATTSFGGRFYRDPRIPRERADGLYQAWVRECCRKRFADDVVVAVRRNRLVGFLAYQLQPRLQAALGVRVAGRGLLAVAARHRGVGLDLVRGGMLHAEPAADFGQFDIHLGNVELLGLYCRVFRMAIAHQRHTFHRWLDRAQPWAVPPGPDLLDAAS